MLKRVACFITLALLIVCSNAQTKTFHVSSEGIPASRLLFESEQVWDVAQDSSGLLYVAGSKLLEYDGISSRVVTHKVIRSLEVSSNGRIYGGGIDEFGYIEMDRLGLPYFHSLADRLRDSGEIDQIEAVLIDKTNVYFAGSNSIYRYDEIEDTLSVFHTPTRAYPLFTYRGKVFSVVNDRGIFEIQQDSLVYFPDQPSFNGIGATSVLTYKDSLILLSADFGSMVLKNAEYQPLDLIDKYWLMENVLYRVQEISEDYLCFSFLKGGAVITDKKFRPIVRFDESQGFDDHVYSVVSGIENELFLCTKKGVFVLDLNSRITYHGTQTGLRGLVTDIEEVGQDLLVSTFDGVYQTSWLTNEDPTKKNANRFQKITASEIYSYDLLPTVNGTLVNAYQSVGVIEKGKYTRLVSKLSSNGFVTFSPDSTLILATGNAGNEVIVLSAGTENNWVLRNRIDTRDHAALFNSFRKIQWDDNLHKYWGTTSNSVFSIEFDASMESLVEVQFYDESHGLPVETGNTVVRLGNEVRFLTNFGLYAYDIASSRFVKDNRFGNLFDETGFYLLSMKNEDEYWYVSRNGTRGLIYRKDISDPFQLASKSASHLPPNEQTLVHTSGAVLIGGHKGLARIENPLEVSYECLVPVLFRRISTFNNQRDSVISYGAEQLSIPIFSRESNSFSFQYSLPYFIYNERISYSYKLQGYEELWSKYSEQTQKEYTNLPSGEYTMMVKARNVYCSESPVGKFSFRIRKAWYETIWAYFCYAVLFIGTIWGVVQINARRLKRENEKLEKKINDRTEEIRYQAEKLRTLDNAKSRFFANISHELRTPLTLIQGPLESVLNGSLGKVSNTIKSNLDLSRSSTKKLLNLVEEILDLSKLEAGKLELKTEAVKFYDLVRRIFFTYQSSYSAKNIDFKFNYQLNEEIVFRVDIGKFEKVLDNLMSNAVKFTPENGEIKMKVFTNAGTVYVEVSDTGVGIAEDEQEQVFDRFYQAGKDKKYSGGTGIGLSLAKELSHLMGGDLRVKSSVGSGSTFTLTVPLEEAQKEDIVLEAEGFLAESQSSNTQAQPTDPLHLKETRILVVEDNDEMRSYIKMQLESYHVDEATDGVEAIQMVEEAHYDLIITDLMMPKLDGLDLVAHLRENDSTKNVSVIMLTARAADEDVVEGFEIGVNDYMTKPFNPQELRARVNNILENRVVLLESIEEGVPDSADEKLVNELKAVVKSNIKLSSFNVTSLADEVAISERQLNRNIKKITGLTAGKFIREIRLNEARILLESKTYNTISEVCYAVGFEKPGYFSEIYFERFGKKPADYL